MLSELNPNQVLATPKTRGEIASMRFAGLEPFAEMRHHMRMARIYKQDYDAMRNKRRQTKQTREASAAWEHHVREAKSISAALGVNL